jgi:hypothetical protein
VLHETIGAWGELVRLGKIAVTRSQSKTTVTPSIQKYHEQMSQIISQKIIGPSTVPDVIKERST